MCENIIKLSKKYFIIITPNRLHPLEFHTKIPLIHWMPKKIHRKILKFLGFNLINISDLERWWSRCIGTIILALNIGLALDTNIEQPLYTAGSLVTVSTLTLFNLHQVVMRPYKSISNKQVLMSWLPNLLMSGIVIGVLASGLLYV